MENAQQSENKPKLVVFASPKCLAEPKLHKDYLNVAWFVQAYADVLNEYDILTTKETQWAVSEALKSATKDERWDVVCMPNILASAKPEQWGFDGLVALAGAVARKEVERVLMFMDPLDTRDHLPETHAFIRNCTLADVGLHINLGATYWAESVMCQKKKLRDSRQGFGSWYDGPPSTELMSRLNPSSQRVHFIAHENEKPKLCKLVFDYRASLYAQQKRGWSFSGTAGTCERINKFLSERLPPFEQTPHLEPVGTQVTGHGPTGGDLVIADEVRLAWPVDQSGPTKRGEEPTLIPKAKVRDKPITHTILFFIDYHHAQPHEADVHVLLRTCLNPYRGVHLILNNRTAVDWANTLYKGTFESTT